jgi:hypothetical protein
MKTTRIWIVCSLFLATSVGAVAQDYGGAWIAVVTDSTSDCKNITKARPGEYQLTIVHQGDELTITENAARRPYTGFMEADNPRHIQLRGSYADSGGYISEEVYIKFADAGAGTGKSAWRWSDGWHQCGGRFIFTLEKKPPQ